MNRLFILCLLLAGICHTASAQKVVLKEIHKTVTPNYTRYQYVFSFTNHETHTAFLLIRVMLLDANGGVLARRFLSFETRGGATQESSIESHHGPKGSDNSAKAVSSYRLEIRDGERNKTYDLEGGVDVPLILKRGPLQRS
jgi:hypothetical protein